MNKYCIQGAYDVNHVYSQDDIAKVIDFANFRGIRVIVEFDTPVSMKTRAHSTFHNCVCTYCYNYHRGTLNHGVKDSVTCLQSATLVIRLQG